MILVNPANHLGNVVVEVLDILSGCVLAFPTIETEIAVNVLYLMIFLIILINDPGNDGLLDLKLATVDFASHSSKTQEFVKGLLCLLPDGLKVDQIDQ